MRVSVLGVGATGSQVAKSLRRVLPDAELVLVDRDPRIAHDVAAGLGGEVAVLPSLTHALPADVVVLCVPTGQHAELAATAVRRGAHVVSCTDAVNDLEPLFSLDGAARRAARCIVVGTGFSPGLSCILARHAAALFDEVEEIAVAKSGTGGPDCARQHHRALRARNWEWRDGGWIQRRGSSGRRLVWFPDLIGARDCYRAGLSEPFLLQRGFPGSRRLAARMAATRRDRLTGWLPMLRRPHADGGPGGLRVEIWGRRAGVPELVVYGAVDHPAYVAGVVSAVSVVGLERGWFPPAGVFGLAEVADPVAMLTAVTRLGVQIETFEGGT